ncbi:MAG: 50S ribosomal protein L30e [Promethearchaeota archaeon]
MSEKSKMAILNRNLRITVKTGKIVIGKESVTRTLRTGQAKLLIMANNLPKNFEEELLYHTSLQSRKIETFVYPGSSWDLGNQVGRPFMIGAILVENPGDSKLLEVVKDY